NDVVNRNPYPCFAGVLEYTPSAALSGQLVYFGGVEPFRDAPEGQPWRHLLDATATWLATSELAVATEVGGGFESNNFGVSRWLPGALYARIPPLPHLFAAVRTDWFHEHDATGAARLFFPADDVSSGTLTTDYRPADQISLRVEYRLDRASGPMYF